MDEVGAPETAGEILRVGPPPREIYAAVEYASVDVPLASLMDGQKLVIYDEVTSKGFFSLSLRGDSLVFRAGGFIGLIPINDRVAIQVAPRVPVTNVARLLLTAEVGATALRPHERFYSVGEEQPIFVLDYLAEVLARQVLEIGALGLHREYVKIVEESAFPSGSILLGPTVERHLVRGEEFVVTQARFKQTADIGTNRCLKYALWAAASRLAMTEPRTGVARNLRLLNQAFQVLGTVSLDRARGFLQDPIVRDPAHLPGLRDYYGLALRVAVLLSSDRGVSLDPEGDDVRLVSWVVNMANSFEAYVRNVLAREMRCLDPGLRVLDGNIGGPNGARKALFEEGPSVIHHEL